MKQKGPGGTHLHEVHVHEHLRSNGALVRAHVRTVLCRKHECRNMRRSR